MKFIFLILSLVTLQNSISAMEYPLHGAASRGDLVRITELLNKGIDIDQRDGSERTAVSLAAENGHTSVVEALITANAAIDLDNGFEGLTPLHYAACNGHAAVVKVLIAANAKIDLISNLGWTPLMLAANNGHKTVVELLVAEDANTDVVSSIALTPLMLAVNSGHIAIVKALIAAGANLGDMNPDSRLTSPLFFALERHNQEMIDLLVDYGLRIDSAKKRAPDIALALAMGTHHRLGAECPFTQELLRYISKLAIEAEMHDARSAKEQRPSWCIIS